MLTVVTGGSRGIGAAICRCLAADGHDIVLGYRAAAERAEATAAAVRAAGARCVTAEVDVADADDVDALFAADCDVRDAAGRPVRVTAHQFRHTVGTRMINNDVSLEVVQRMLDHGSPEMTARYATIKDQTLRREWERFQQRINIQGELIPLDPAGSPISDAAWALENLARAKQTLPNGYCGLPLQQTCPHPNACLTCDSFLTTAEFLPQHRDQLIRTEQLIAQADADGRQRLVEINEPVRLNLIRIIDGLEALEGGNGG